MANKFFRILPEYLLFHLTGDDLDIRRGIEQSEVINFVNFATDGKSEFEIIPEKPFEKVDIRPKSLGITPVVTADGVIKFTIDKNAYFTVEPYGRNDALHVFVDKQKEYDVNINAENISLKWDE